MRKAAKQAKTDEIGVTASLVVAELKPVGAKLPKLTIKQERFVNIMFMNPDMYAHDVYMEAGYRPKTKETAKVCASVLLTKPNLQLYLSQLRAVASVKTGIDAAKVVESFIDVSKRAKETNDLANENRALENLGKHLGIFDKDNQQRAKPFVLVFNHKREPKKVICEQSDKGEEL